jgi:hypothetical protein
VIPLARLLDESAGLRRCDVAGRELLHAVQHGSQTRQLVAAVPQMQAGEVFTNAQGLLVAEIKVAVQPPVGDVVEVVVPQLHGAAGGQRCGQGQQTDNPAKSRYGTHHLEKEGP